MRASEVKIGAHVEHADSKWQVWARADEPQTFWLVWRGRFTKAHAREIHSLYVRRKGRR